MIYCVFPKNRVFLVLLFLVLVFLVHSLMASVLLSASVERCFVSRMRDFLCFHHQPYPSAAEAFLFFCKDDWTLSFPEQGHFFFGIKSLETVSDNANYLAA